MDNKDIDVKDALDDLFGEDVLEVDSSISDENKNNVLDIDSSVSEENKNNVLDIDSGISEENKNNVFDIDSGISDENKNNVFDIDSSISEENKNNVLDIDSSMSEENKNNVLEKNAENNDDHILTEEKEETNEIDNIKNDKDIDFKKIILYVIIGFMIGLILMLLLTNKLNNSEKVINCSYKAEDEGYKVSDEYKITYASNKIKHVDGTYIYTAKTTEFEEQIPYIKEEKLLAIINSNGMSGFTYLYETSNDYFKVESYLNFNEMDFKKVDKTNWKSSPISYFEFSSKTTLKGLKETLEKEGYSCVNSK